jgi:hypothetical protein
MGANWLDRRGLHVRSVQEEGGRQNRTLHLLVVTPGYWPTGLPEQRNVSDFILSRVVLDW